MSASPGPSRLGYLDWLRGVAVVLMIVWHAGDAWARPAAHATRAFAILAFLGGWAAPLFLFLAGVSIALAGASRVARGQHRRAVAGRLARRGGQVFLLAIAMRLPTAIFNPAAGRLSLVAPDILNVLGIGMIAGALAWAGATSRASRALLLAGPAVVIVLIVTPWLTLASWPAALPPEIEAYFRPNGAYGVFSVFPWIAFVFAGVWAGELIGPARNRRALVAAGLVGASLVGAGAIGMRLPSLLPTEFWTTSTSWMAMRTGTLFLAMPAAAGACWILRDWPWTTAPLVVLGQTSLFVYFVHLQLTYAWSQSPIYRALDARTAIVAALALAALMAALGGAWRAVRHRVRLGRAQSPARSRP